MTHLSPSWFTRMLPVFLWFEINAQWSEWKEKRDGMFFKNREVFTFDFAGNFKVALPHRAVCFSLIPS